MNKLAIIGGSGFLQFQGLKIREQYPMTTPWGTPSAAITVGEYRDTALFFLPRHGPSHHIPPHKINYRANIWAFRELGVTDIIAINAVGGITQDMSPGCIVIPDQIIDYSWGRANTYFDDTPDQPRHIDFTRPYSESLRQGLIKAVDDQPVVIRGVHGVTQGPRLETAAEIRRMERDGCDIVGMTGMPEAALAVELGLGYACCALIVNWAAGKSDKPVTMVSIERYLHQGARQVYALIEGFLSHYSIP